MTIRHLPHYAPNADCVVFDGDGSVWVRVGSVMYAVEHADELCDTGETYLSSTVYATRESAEDAARRIERDNDLDAHAWVVEMEVAR